jgi:Tol biopolymer transport system component
LFAWLFKLATGICIAVTATIVLALLIGFLRQNAMIAYIEMYGEAAQARVVDVDHRIDRLISNYTDCQVEWMPSGDSLLLTRMLPGERHQVFTVTLRRDYQYVLTQGGLHNEAPSLSPDGKWIVFSPNRRDVNTLHLMRIDGSDLRPLAEVPLWVNRTQWSPDGAFVIATGMEDNRREVTYMIHVASGRVDPRTDVHSLGWSPDGRYAVYDANTDTGRDLFVQDMASESSRRLTNSPEIEDHPLWSPDGDWLAYITVTPEGQEIRILNVRSSFSVTLASGFRDIGVLSWARDGRRVAFSAQSRASDRLHDRLTPYNLYVVNRDGSGFQLIRRGFGAYVNNFSRFCAIQWSP